MFLPACEVSSLYCTPDGGSHSYFIRNIIIFMSVRGINSKIVFILIVSTQRIDHFGKDSTDIVSFLLSKAAEDKSYRNNDFP